MQSLVAFSLLVVAALADPQVFGRTYGGYPAGVYGAYPGYVGGYVAGSPVVAGGAVYPYAATPYAATPYVATVAYPSQDTSRGLPQPVEDTYEVKAAKARFAAEYQNAAVTHALAKAPVYGAASVYGAAPVFGSHVVAVESRHKRDLAAVQVPAYKSFQTPASTSPLVYAAAPVATTYAAAPYAATTFAAATPYAAATYGATPYAAATYAGATPYVYGNGYYNTYGAYGAYPYAY